MNWYYWIVVFGAIVGCVLHAITDNIYHVYIWSGAALLSSVTSWMFEIKNILKELVNELHKFNNIDVKINHVKE